MTALFRGQMPPNFSLLKFFGQKHQISSWKSPISG